jgi:hypothetical protein
VLIVTLCHSVASTISGDNCNENNIFLFAIQKKYKLSLYLCVYGGENVNGSAICTVARSHPKLEFGQGNSAIEEEIAHLCLDLLT